MYLKEVVVISFLALVLSLLNLIVKYYFIYKRGYRISNLILIKLAIRFFSIICFSCILILGLGSSSSNNKKNLNGFNYILTVKSFENNIVLEKALIIKISELVNSQNENKASLLIQILDSNKLYVAIPSTSRITFLSLIHSTNLHFDVSTLKRLDSRELKQSNASLISINSNNKDQLVNYRIFENNSIINFLNKWFEIPFIHLYLLILMLFFVSFDLFTKFQIIKN